MHQIGRCWGAEGSCLCIVKPHVVAADRLHLVLAAITERFRLTGMRTCNFGSRAAGKLLEIYKGVLPLGEYSAAVEEMGSGETQPAFDSMLEVFILPSSRPL